MVTRSDRPTLARYEILGRLASGGMGEVWLARAGGRAGFEKLVALKTIRNDTGAVAATEMFLREARVAALLGHPNCVQVFDLAEEAGTYVIAMEYIDGLSFARVLRRAEQRNLPIPIPVVARIAMDVASGLDYAHTLKDSTGRPLGLVHRDISLENILITFSGQTKIVDFGIAKASAVAVEHTETGQLKGKYAYMSPEYLRGEPIDARADLFALGVVVFRALTRRKPFDGDTDVHVTTAIISTTPAPRVRDLRPDVSEPLDDVVATMLAKNPRERFDNARAMRSALVAAVPDAADIDAVGAYMTALWSEDDEDRVAVRRLIAGEHSSSSAVLSATPPSADFGRSPIATQRAPRASSVAETVPGPNMRTVRDAEPPQHPRPRRRSTLPVALAIGAAIAAGTVYIVTRTSGSSPHAVAPPIHDAVVAIAARSDAGPKDSGNPAHERVAVLPFVATGTAPPPNYIVSGLRDALTQTLAQLAEVTLATDKATEGAAAAPPDRIGRSLGVGAIVTGHVASADEHLQIDVAVIDTASGRQLWSKHYSGLTPDLLTLEDQLNRDVIAALGITPSTDEAARLLDHATESYDAYELYLEGRTASRDVDEKTSQQAGIKLYEQALAKDPRFALAYAAISENALRIYERTRLATWSTRALSAAQQAAQLDDKLAAVHTALGNVYRRIGRTAEAIAELRTATQLEPGSDDAYRHLGSTYLKIGRTAEAIAAYQQAIAANPYFFANYGALSVAYGRTGEIEKAIALDQKMIELVPDNPTAYNELGTDYRRLGKQELALEALQKSVSIHAIPEALSNLGTIYGEQGDTAKSIAMFEKALALMPHDAKTIGGLADANWWGGKQQAANALYEKAIAKAISELAITPRDADLRGLLATWYAKRGDAAHADKMIASARAIDKTDTDIMYYEVVIRAVEHRFKDALRGLDGVLASGVRLPYVAADPEPCGAAQGFPTSHRCSTSMPSRSRASRGNR